MANDMGEFLDTWLNKVEKGMKLSAEDKAKITGAGSFESDSTKLRFIDRFDVELIDDGAFAAASFKTVADQTTGTTDTGK